MLNLSKKQLSVLLALLAIFAASAFQADYTLIVFITVVSSFTVGYHFALSPKTGNK